MSTQEYLDSLAQQETSPTLSLPTATIRSEIVEMCRNAREPDRPPDLVARPCRLPPALWHWYQLDRLLNKPGDRDEVSPTRMAFHARWIRSLADPDSIALHPLVSIVIPVHNRAGIVGEAIESALAQNYRPIEVIVVDDGSTDEIEAAVEPFRGKIQFARQVNQGVSRARNHGVDLAKGDYLHFLDSDNLLSPDVVDRWVSACRYVGDAELSYCPANFEWLTSLLPEFTKPPDGGLDCPTTDLMNVIARRHPFFMLSVLIPRWLVLETGGFDERLRWYEDTRFWFTVGLRGTKVVGLRNRRNQVRRNPAGLSATPRPEGNRGRVRLLDTLDVLDSPDHWLHFPSQVRAIHHGIRWLWIGSSDEPLVVESRKRLLSQVGLLGRSGRTCGLSSRPLLSLFEAGARESRKRLGDLGDAASFHRQFMQEIDVALSKAPPNSRRDVEYWLPEFADSSLDPEWLISLNLLILGHRGLGSIAPDSRFWTELDRVAAAPRKDAVPGKDESAFHNSMHALPNHCGTLAQCLQQEKWTPWRCDKAAYHAAWILRLLNSDDTASVPLLTLVLSVHNHAHRLKKTVASCLNQSYSPIELIVVDDGSTEDIEAALRPWADRLRLLRQTKQDKATARNWGILHARGQMIKLLDCDDQLAPDAFERDVLALHHISDAELVSSAAQLVGDRSGPRYPFLTSTALLPSWVIWEADLFDTTQLRIP